MMATATKTAPAKKANPPAAAPEKPAEKVQETPAATFDWDALSDPSAVEYTTAAPGSSVDWEATTPEPIKARVKESYAAYQTFATEETERIRRATGSYDLTAPQTKRIADLAGRAASRRQTFPNADMAEAFLKMAKGYAAHLGYTLRGGVDKDHADRVVYRVKPKETRARS